MLDESGKPVDEAWKARRRDMLIDAFRRLAPDVLLVELFPFGRRFRDGLSRQIVARAGVILDNELLAEALA